jgi:predicted alpha/beta hydrolase family esterase
MMRRAELTCSSFLGSGVSHYGKAWEKKESTMNELEAAVVRNNIST